MGGLLGAGCPSAVRKSAWWLPDAQCPPSSLWRELHVGDAKETAAAALEEAVPVVTLEPLSGVDAGIALLTLNRPKAKNAISRRFLEQLRVHLHAVVGSLDDRGSSLAARVLILRSAVEGVFSAGADLKERRAMTPREAAEFVDSLRETFTTLECLPIPTIAAVDGVALGGGLELAMACDLRVCGASAQLALPETSLAIIPGAGGTQRLPRLVGRAVAKELIFTGRRVGAEEARAIGLANATAPAGEALQGALGMARQMLTKGPVALRYAKYAIDRGLDLEMAAGLSVERGKYMEILQTEDRLEGLEAFADKRPPSYRGQ